MNHKILHNSNLLVDWKELFEYIQIYCDDEQLHKYTQLAANSNNCTCRLRILGDNPAVPCIQEKLDEFFSIFNLEDFKQKKEQEQKYCFCAIYFSFFPRVESHGNHCDDTDLFHWQQVGQTEWKIVEDKTEYTYILNPGDCIFIPEGVYHDVTPLTPRIGLSFGFLKEDAAFRRHV